MRDEYVAFADTKNVRGIPFSGVLPADTKYFPDEVPANFELRSQWLSKAISATKKCPMVFLDPDNGLKPGWSHKEMRVRGTSITMR